MPWVMRKRFWRWLSRASLHSALTLCYPPLNLQVWKGNLWQGWGCHSLESCLGVGPCSLYAPPLPVNLKELVIPEVLECQPVPRKRAYGQHYSSSVHFQSGNMLISSPGYHRDAISAQDLSLPVSVKYPQGVCSKCADALSRSKSLSSEETLEQTAFR